MDSTAPGDKQAHTIPMMGRREGETIREIRCAVSSGRLRQPFRAAAVNRALAVTFAGNFMPKHRIGNPAGNTELFRRVGSGE